MLKWEAIVGRSLKRDRMDPANAARAPKAARCRALCLAGLALAVWLGAAGAAVAQEAATSSVEFWPETDVWLRLSPAWRFSTFIALSKNVDTKYREGNLILQTDLSFGKFKNALTRRMMDEDRARIMRRFLLRAGYLGGKSLDDQGEAYSEATALVELHVRTPLKGRFLVSHRLRTDFRWLGDDHAFSTRYRYRLMVEKEYVTGRASIVPYVNGEGYYDSRYRTVNRVRLVGGATVAWTSLFALEGNFTYQYDTRASITNVYALNVILHVFL